jgi:hypothetical protein
MSKWVYLDIPTTSLYICLYKNKLPNQEEKEKEEEE